MDLTQRLLKNRITQDYHGIMGIHSLITTNMITTEYESDIIGCHRSEILPDEGSNKVSKPNLDTDSKPDLDITQCTNYLFNDPLNLNINTPSYNFSYKY